jgi:hypothetical protein
MPLLIRFLVRLRKENLAVIIATLPCPKGLAWSGAGAGLRLTKRKSKTMAVAPSWVPLLIVSYQLMNCIK